ncbi:MAG TPA: hypothetical protein VG123_40685 [Streptosporangiaceae bacterium]|nr:hypothetical protein [Streptosporangiaceae bacterium]
MQNPSRRVRALLALYQALRIAITDATATMPGTDPDRASYQIAVETAQTLTAAACNVIASTAGLASSIGRAVLASLHPPRRPRVYARRVKSPCPAGTSIRPANRVRACGSPRSPPRSAQATRKQRHTASSA